METIRGFILLVSHYKDNDAILNILSKNGIYSYLGRGFYNLNSKNLILTESFIEGDFEIYKGKVGGYKIKACKIINYFSNYSKSYKKSILFNLISELTLKTYDGISDFNALYNLTIFVFKGINDTNIEFNYAILFIGKYFNLLGIKPLFDFSISYKYFNIDDGVLTNTFEKDKNIIELSNEEEKIFKDTFSNENILNDIICESCAINIFKIFGFFLESKTDLKLNSLELF